MRALPLQLPLGLSLVLCASTFGQDWPTFRGDLRRSGAVESNIEADHLVPAWTWRSPELPSPAWPGPARWDAYAALKNLRSMRNYDPVFHPIAFGDSIVLASNVDDSVRCFDATDGALRWTYVTGGPVRIAPSLHEGRLYFGSDDGAAYCIDAKDGQLVWRYHPTEGERMVIQDGRLVSFWPVRTGVAVYKGRAYFGASLLPWKNSFLCSVDADTGKLKGSGTWKRDLGSGLTLEGALLASMDNVIAPQGRIPPLLFNRESGAPEGTLEGGGGCFVLLTEDQEVLHGPGNKDGWITGSKSASRQKVASYAKGNAMVVEGQTAWLLSDDALAAMDRTSGTALWTLQADAPYEIIKAGQTLFCGGENKVVARSVEDGHVLWAAEVEGRAHGLAVAHGRLLVATDQGVLHVFSEGGAAIGLAAKYTEVSRKKVLGPSPSIPKVPTRGLVDRWVFQSNTRLQQPLSDDDPRTQTVFVNQVRGRLAAHPLGSLDLRQVGSLQAVVLDGTATDLAITSDLAKAKLPTKAITAAAWVRVDQAIQWGGIISAAQDNGEDEKGWLLGFSGNKFCFVVTGTKGDTRLTRVADPKPFQVGTWYHVVGTYDGRVQRLWVNGEMVAESTKEKGPILAPATGWYHIGAYRDNDEYFRHPGMLNEIAVWSRALKDKEIRALHDQKAADFPGPVVIGGNPLEPTKPVLDLAFGPILRFPKSGTAFIRWQTASKHKGVLEWRAEGAQAPGPWERVVCAEGTQHEGLIQNLPRNTVLSYRLRAGVHKDAPATGIFELDTHFDLTLPAVDRDQAGAWAEGQAGLALVIGADDSPDALIELARKSRYRILVVDEDSQRIADLRRKLHAHSAYGSRIAALQVADLDHLPLPSAYAAFVTGSDRHPAPNRSQLAEVQRVQSPGGLIQWGEHTSTRGPLPGARSWGHMYGSADNSAYNGEELGGVRTVDQLDVNWLGRPGARYQSDRQNRKAAPLTSNGRLFMQGLHRVIALDAFSGQALWNVELPSMARFNVPRDCANSCAEGEEYFLAMQGFLFEFDGEEGHIKRQIPVQAGARDDFEWDWGYVAATPRRIVGTPVKAGAPFTAWWGGDAWYDAREGEAAKKVCGDGIFGLDRASGDLAWQRSGSLVLHPTITIADGAVSFLECRNTELLEADARRIGSSKLWEDLWLVSLDLQTGQVLWEREATPVPGRVAIYLAQSDGKLVMVSSAGGEFAVYAFDADNGASLWRRKFTWEVDHHGKSLSRPLIVNGKVYLRPAVMDLETGEPQAQPFPEGHQCGTYVASKNALFLRAGELAVWDVLEGRSTRWKRLRPDCWISTIPAEGMLLSPEGGGGCSCGTWIQTSIGFMPKDER